MNKKANARNGLLYVAIVAIVALFALTIFFSSNSKTNVAGNAFDATLDENPFLISAILNGQPLAVYETTSGLIRVGGGSCIEGSGPDGESTCSGSCEYGSCQTGNVGKCVCKYP
ncbi:MAG TPA: hypothetical protein VI968_02805 [archaeon]|nr:hypothetical protein [archaeon]